MGVRSRKVWEISHKSSVRNAIGDRKPRESAAETGENGNILATQRCNAWRSRHSPINSKFRRTPYE
ncbi:MAG: hypothetical protein ACI9BW_002201 [Gammaproteobacteria bacterium]|jgi:hypothetical protein